MRGDSHSSDEEDYGPGKLAKEQSAVCAICGKTTEQFNKEQRIRHVKRAQLTGNDSWLNESIATGRIRLLDDGDYEKAQPWLPPGPFGQLMALDADFEWLEKKRETEAKYNK